jgi:hypothetical protein
VPDGAVFNVAPGGGGHVVAQFHITDALFMGLTRTGARLKTIDILKYAHAAYPDADEVEVQGMFPTKDAYGNDDPNTVVVDVVYDQSTLNKINFDGMDSDRIWDIRDGGTVHPDMQS